MTDTASLVLKVDSTDVDRGAKSLDQLARSGEKADATITALSKANEVLAGVVRGVVVTFGALKLAQLAQESAMLAARFETMGVVMKVAGNNAGYTAAEMDKYSKALQQSGISMMQSRNSLVQLATAHIDLAQAQKIGRAAQDLAVVGGINSSEAMERMIHGIKAGQIEVLRTIGLNVNFEAGYKELAASLGITTEALTEQQKTTSRTNAVLQEAARYTGIYEESMGTAGKAISSLTRYWEDLKVKAGEVFLPALGDAVFKLTDALKAANIELDRMGGDGTVAGAGKVMDEAFKTTFQTVAVLAANLSFVLVSVGRELGALAAQAAIIADKGVFDKGARAQIAAISDAVVKDGQTARAALDAFEAKIMSTSEGVKKASKYSEEAQIAAGKAADAKAAADDKAAAAAKKHTDEVKKAASAYAATQKHASDFIAALDKEIALYNKSEVQKKEYEAAQIASTLNAGREREAFEAMTQARMIDINAQRAETAAAESRIIAFNEDEAARNAENDNINNGIESLRKREEVIIAETYALTHSAEEVRLHNIELELEASKLDKLSPAYIELEKRIRAASDAFADAKHSADIADAARKSADQAAKEWERASEQIAQSLTDNIMRGGKSGGELLEDYFRTLILRPIIQGTVQVGMNAIGLGSTSSLGGILQTGSGLLDLGSLGTMTSYGTAAATGGLFGGASQGAMLAAQTADFGVAGAAATAEALGGAASSLGALSAVLGPIAIGVAALTALGAFDANSVPKNEAMGGDLSVKGDWSTTNMDAGYTATADAFKQQFASTLSAFGADAAQTMFSFMTSSDPTGGAPDFGLASGTVNGQQFGVQYAQDGSFNAATDIPELMARSLIAAFKTVDMGPVANAIVAAAGDASTMSDELLAQTNAALAGAAALFGTTSPLQAAMDSARSTASNLSIQLQAVGIAGGVSGQSMIDAVNALDLTTTAGQQAASAMLALQPAVSAYETQLLGVFGFTADSLKTNLLDAIANSPDAATAGETFAENVVGGIQTAMLGDLASQITSIVTSGIIQPALNALITGQSVSEVLSDANIKAVIDKATATAAAFSAIWNDPTFQAAMDSIQSSISSATSAALAYVPANLYQQPDTASVAADTSAADTATQNALDLASQMADVSYQMSTLNLNDLSKSLADAAKSTQDAVDSAIALGAAQDQLDQIFALGAAQAVKLVTDAQTALFQPLADAAATLGMDSMTAATYAAQKAYADTVAQIDEFVLASNGLADPLQVATAYANALAIETNSLTQIQKEYTDSVVTAQAAISSATQSAWNDQVSVVTQIQNWIDQITGLSKNIDARIFDIKYAAEGADQAAMLREKEAAQWAEFNSYQVRANDESVTHQIDLAGQIADTITERYRVETKAIEDTTKSIDGLAGFAKKLKDYANDLKIGSLSPLGLIEKTTEAGKQVSELLAVLRNPMSSLDDIESARGDITGAITNSLTLSQQSSATALDYGRAYAKAQAELALLEDDTLTEAERQTTILKSIASSTEDTIAELESIQALVDSWLPGVNDYLVDQVAALAALQTELNVLGVDLVDAINGLPNAIAALLGSAVVVPVGGSGHISNPTSTPTTEPSIDSVMNYAALSGDVRGAVQMAQSYGISSAGVAAAMGSGVTAAEVSAWAVSQGLPAFATGINAGILPSDQIIKTHGGERITPAIYVDQEKAARDETNKLLAKLLAENETMRLEMVGMKKEMENTQRNTKRHADLFENVTVGGDAMRSNVVQSVAVPVA